MQIYRLITGPDDNAFCHRVTAALNKGAGTRINRAGGCSDASARSTIRAYASVSPPGSA